MLVDLVLTKPSQSLTDSFCNIFLSSILSSISLASALVEIIAEIGYDSRYGKGRDDN